MHMSSNIVTVQLRYIAPVWVQFVRKPQFILHILAYPLTQVQPTKLQCAYSSPTQPAKLFSVGIWHYYMRTWATPCQDLGLWAGKWLLLLGSNSVPVTLRRSTSKFTTPDEHLTSGWTRDSEDSHIKMVFAMNIYGIHWAGDWGRSNYHEQVL